jgi:hypothetical protein
MSDSTDAEGLPAECRSCGERERMEGAMVCEECNDTEQEAESFGADVFRIVAPEDGDMEFTSDILGIGVDFPNHDVYVDWNVDAWPDDEQLSGGHVSIYSTIEDARQVAQGTIEPIATLDPAEAEDLLEDIDTEAVENPEFTEGDAVRWSWDGQPVHGRVADVVDQYTPPDASEPITGEEDEAVYVIDEWDDDVGAYRRRNVGKPESSLTESDRDMPPRTDENYAAAAAGSDWSVRELDAIAAEMDVLSRAESGTGTVVWQSADRAITYFAELPEKYADAIGAEAFVPPEGVVENAQQALEWYENHPDEFDAGAEDGEGVRRARQLVRHYDDDEPLAPEYIVEIQGYLSRSDGQDGRAELDADVPDNKPWLDSGYAAHMLWGGDAALSWTEDLVERMEDVDAETEQQAATVSGTLLTYSMGGVAVDDQDEYEAFADELVDRGATLLDLKTSANPDVEPVRYPPDLPDAHDPQILVQHLDAETVAEVMSQYDGVNFDEPESHEPTQQASDWQSDGPAAPVVQAAASAETDLRGPGLESVTKAGSNEIDVEALPEAYQEALEAEDFLIYGKASIEQWDRSDDPIKIEMEALEAALDRFFDSDDAPGIISLYHDDIPVGVPVREHTLDEDTTLQLESPDGDPERYEFEAGDTLTSHVEDGDGDGRPEMWLLSNIANDSEMAKEVRLRALQGQLNGYSVTIHRNKDRETETGRIVEACDLHAVTLGTSEIVKNAGSTFDVAEYQAFNAD